jgi:outer membrane lipoprotein-sorting protein
MDGTMKIAALCFALLLAVSLRAETNSIPGLERLRAVQDRMASVRTVQADFEQEKNLSLFKQKIVVSGRIYIESSGRFSWHAEKPVRYRLFMNGDDVRQWDEDTRQVQRVPTAGNPIFKMATGQMRDWFSGHYEGMLKEYEATVSGDAALTARFVPKPGTITAKALRSVEVSLAKDAKYIDSIRIEDLSGDATTIRFKNVILNEAIAPAAWEVVPRE